MQATSNIPDDNIVVDGEDLNNVSQCFLSSLMIPFVWPVHKTLLPPQSALKIPCAYTFPSAMLS